MEYAVYQEASKSEQLSAELNSIDGVAHAVIGECASGVVVAFITDAVFLRSEGKRIDTEVIGLASKYYGEGAVVTKNSAAFYALLFAVEADDTARIEEVYKSVKSSKRLIIEKTYAVPTLVNAPVIKE